MAEIYFLISPQNYPSSKYRIHRPAHFHIQRSDMYPFPLVNGKYVGSFVCSIKYLYTFIILSDHFNTDLLCTSPYIAVLHSLEPHSIYQPQPPHDPKTSFPGASGFNTPAF